jgi:hypothetical protein
VFFFVGRLAAIDIPFIISILADIPCTDISICFAPGVLAVLFSFILEFLD